MSKKLNLNSLGPLAVRSAPARTRKGIRSYQYQWSVCLKDKTPCTPHAALNLASQVVIVGYEMLIKEKAAFKKADFQVCRFEMWGVRTSQDAPLGILSICGTVS